MGLYAEEEIFRGQRYRRKGRTTYKRITTTQQQVVSTEQMEITFLTVEKIIPLKWRE